MANGNEARTSDPRTTADPSPGPSSRDIEEGRAAYRPYGFHPVYIGDVFHDRYQVLNKIGYGVYSTVWLVKDLEHKNEDCPETKFRALKVLSAESYGHKNDIFEREILIHLRNTGRGQLGYNYTCHLIQDFEHQGPNGTHVCFIFELMGETLRSFGAWFKDNMVPESVMRRFTIQLVLALDYAHDIGVIHTDIKPNNIFVKFRDYSLVERYLAEVSIPRQNRDEESYTVIPSRPLRRFYFNEADSRHVDEFDIALGDWGVSSWKDRHLTENIQPIALRSPEVLLKASWDETTDWWNLGAVVLEVFRTIRLFSGRAPPDGHYEVREHLAEIVNLFGPFPRKLLDRSDKRIVEDMFDEEGQVKGTGALNRPGLATETWLPGLNQEDRELFTSFLKAMMKIEPSERASAVELLRHPWLGAMQ